MANNNVQVFTDIDKTTTAISSQIAPVIEEVLKKDVMDYYGKLTAEYKKKELEVYKANFKEHLDKMEKEEVPVADYFEAYEDILKFRQFILGELGAINYTFSLRAIDSKQKKVFMKNITLGRVEFIELMGRTKNKKDEILGLDKTNGNLRFSTAFLQQLRQYIKNIQANNMSFFINSKCSHYILVNEDLGAREQFTNGKLFKSKIEAIQRNNERSGTDLYIFDLDLKKSQQKDQSTGQSKTVFSLSVRHVDGNPKSSSIFSAVGKYFADEMIQKRDYVKKNNININPNYPNAGNLTELYIVAKHRLNNGHNTFPERTPVPGETLFNLWKQVRRNTDPFFSGGDFLMDQIKSFLGSNPSLTSYKTIQTTVKDFYDILQFSTSTEQIKNKLSKKLLQENSNNERTDNEKQLSKAIAESLDLFFQDLV